MLTVKKFEDAEMKTSSGNITHNAINNKFEEILEKVKELAERLKGISLLRVTREKRDAYFIPALKSIRDGTKDLQKGPFTAHTIDETNEFIELLNTLIEEVDPIED